MSLPNIQPIEKINEISIGQNQGLNNDSFDDEFRLLESTLCLTDIKEDDSKTEDTKNDKQINDSGIFSLDVVDTTCSDSSNCFNKDVNSIPLKCNENTLSLVPREVLNLINNEVSEPIDVDLNSKIVKPISCVEKTENSNLNSEIINRQKLLSSTLPTTQHFKSTDKKFSTKLSLVSSSESVELKSVRTTLNSESNCDLVSETMQSSSESSCSGQENIVNDCNKASNSNVSVVNNIPCDSSFVENQEGIDQVLAEKPVQSNAEVTSNVSNKFLSSNNLKGVDLKCKESENLKLIVDDNSANVEPDLKKCYPESCFKTAPIEETENKNVEQYQNYNMSQLGEIKSVEDVELKSSNVNDLKQNDMVMQSNKCEKAMTLGTTVKNSLEELAGSTDYNLKLNENTEVLKFDTQLENNSLIISPLKTNNGCMETDEKLYKEDEQTDSSNKKIEKSFFCSTPIVCNILKDNVDGSIKFDSNQMSPLNTNYLKSKLNIKRTNLCLERIEEIDESSGSCSEKRIKLGSPITDCENKIILQNNDSNVSLSMPCFEPPAKSILKKWHPSSLSRDSFLILDECGDTDTEETIKPSQESVDRMDDFEVACKSLAEELMMSSSNNETLEKYHSKVQLDSQIDDKKFDEVLQELTLNYELDERSFLSKMQPTSLGLEESKFVTGENVINVSLGTTILNVNENKKHPLTLVHDCAPSDDKTTLGEFGLKGFISVSEADNCLSTKSENNPETSSSSQYTKLECENERPATIQGVDEKLSLDEEDVLLEEDIKVEQKPYVYFEYVSSDPKENEDNYNPEWQKLGKLTSDEERYKAVRDRWRSLVPPDPNRDLTCRQWRKKNNKPPLIIPSLNNNQKMFQFDGNEKNQHCTAVFERKIANILHDSEMSRIQIIKERNLNFEELAVVQDEEQRRLLLRGYNPFEMSKLQKRHIQECVMLKNQSDRQLEEVIKDTQQSVLALKKACEEVMSFQKFYKGVGATNKEVCMYMTDIQVEELMETEEMLDRYSKYYQ